jgi:hypothetical protein
MIIQRVWFYMIENPISRVNQYHPCHSWLRTLVTRVVLIASRDGFCNPLKPNSQDYHNTKLETLGLGHEVAIDNQCSIDKCCPLNWLLFSSAKWPIGANFRYTRPGLLLKEIHIIPEDARTLMALI